MSDRIAPGRLGLIEHFLNTVNLERPAEDEDFSSPEALRAWLLGHELIAPNDRIEESDRRAALELREAIRALAYANHEGGPDPDALTRLDELAGDRRLAVRFLPDGSARFESKEPRFQGAAGTLLAIVAGAMADGSWARFKACRRSSCRWAYYDFSKNQSRNWCSMRVCGNREKAAAWRERHKETSG